MTFWYFNPPEPTGQPTAPGPWDAPGQTTPFDGADLFTKGRCGACHACPKVWRLVVPESSGNPLSQYYAGVYYLTRVPYFREIENRFSGDCLWTSRPQLPIPDANTYDGDYIEGWTLAFQTTADYDLTWHLYTPLYQGLVNLHQSLYVPIASHWRCLEANAMRLSGPVADEPFPYTPDVVTLTPYPA